MDVEYEITVEGDRVIVMVYVRDQKGLRLVLLRLKHDDAADFGASVTDAARRARRAAAANT